MRRHSAIAGFTAAVVTAGALLLTGCEPVPTTSSDTELIDCDPSGWGPLSGCDEPVEAEPEATLPTGEGGLPTSCPQDITVTYDPDTGNVSQVEVVTYRGGDEDPYDIQARAVWVSSECMDDLNWENRQFTGWLNDELNKRGVR